MTYIYLYIISIIITVLMISKLVDPNMKYIMYLLLIIILSGFQINHSRTNNLEHLTSDEALQNVASLYNASNMTIANLNVTGNLTVGGTSTLQTLSASNISASGIGTVAGNLNVMGNTTTAGNLNVTGNTTIKALNTSGINNTGTATVGGQIVATGGMTTGGSITYTSTTNPTSWSTYNMNGVLRTNLVGTSIVIDTDQSNGAGTVVTSWGGSDSGRRAKVGTQNACRTDRGAQDGYLWKNNTCGGDWSA